MSIKSKKLFIQTWIISNLSLRRSFNSRSATLPIKDHLGKKKTREGPRKRIVHLSQKWVGLELLLVASAIVAIDFGDGFCADVVVAKR